MISPAHRRCRVRRGRAPPGGSVRGQRRRGRVSDLKTPAYVIWWRREDGRYRRGNVLVRCSVGEPGEEKL
jgi:hypothetical protein